MDENGTHSHLRDIADQERRAKRQDLTDALARLKAQGRPVSASTLRGQTGVAFRTCNNFLGRKAEALGLYLQPDQKTYNWTPAPLGAATAPIAGAPAATRRRCLNTMPKRLRHY
jgi:hypothetical protein